MSAPTTKQIMEQLDTLGQSIDRVKDQNQALGEALSMLVEIIDAAGGPFKLSAAVELGQVSWCVKATDRMEWAKKILARGSEAES